MWSSATIQSAAQYLQSKRGVVTISAGNDGRTYSSDNNASVLTISATDRSDLLASWSARGGMIDVSAPGVSVAVPTRGGGYGYGSGTSFAAPIVAGVAALVISANPDLTAVQIQEILAESADDLGAADWDPSYGFGRVNAARAVDFALQTGGPEPDSQPPVIAFTSPSAGSTVSGVVIVQASASDNDQVASVTLYLDGELAASDSEAPYAFAWDTGSASNGLHALEAVARDASGNTSSAQLTVTVSNLIDQQAPTVSITSPVSGATVNRPVAVTVSTSDDIGVVKVELYVDGKLTSTSTTAPFTNNWNPKKAARGTHSLACKAYDQSGKVGNSQTVTVYK
jgi:hypothetical protein